ncbi:hypothetical protein Patl1_33395 [Pistacia atlantica]|uniref:Uncharacterized protein n=1 Tax=Pistacia atlantica TaxID=434234 RepID=A0ACC0ZRD6_9ROSI|nr:hypothetical protein Patl1_33395 [Pistacia atlantica]
MRFRLVMEDLEPWCGVMLLQRLFNLMITALTTSAIVLQSEALDYFWRSHCNVVEITSSCKSWAAINAIKKESF